MAVNVLIVDDSSSMRNVIKKTLEMSGFDIGQIFEASNGLEALAVLEKNWADVILMDIHMPEMDGFEFLKALHEQDVVSKKHGKEGFKQFFGRSDGVLGFFRPNFCFEQGEVDQKPANRHVEPPFGGGCRII